MTPEPRTPVSAEAVSVPLVEEQDVVRARQAGREMAHELGFGTADQTRLATAISELARNVIRYAKRGVCRVVDATDAETTRVSVAVEDQGPGIADIELAMEDGFSTSRSLGAGLPGAKRLVHEFDISSRPGRTVVTIAIERPRL